jgi:molecular chaperone DnaK
MAGDNKSLGRFILSGIAPAPRGVPQVEVSFDIDANGILNVKAKDKATGQEQKITITASSGLSKEEVEKMQKEAELHADEDKKKKEAVEIKNTADTLVYSTEKTLKDFEGKISEETKKAVTERLDALKKIKDSDDTVAIKKATDELMQAAQKVGEEVYKAQKDAPQPAAGEEKKDSETKEGDFSEKK